MLNSKSDYVWHIVKTGAKQLFALLAENHVFRKTLFDSEIKCFSFSFVILQ